MKVVPSVARGSVGRVCVLFVDYGLLHSLFTSSWAKHFVERFGGRRGRQGLDRPCFILQSGVTTVWALQRFWGLPDRTLYQVPRPWAWVLRAVQTFAVALLLRALAP